MSGFTHFDTQGDAVMVDVRAKAQTAREASAAGQITMSAACYREARSGGAQKGDVFGVARVAGLMAVKRTSELIPLCHALPLENAAISFTFNDEARTVTAACTVKTTGKTGVEMEALTGVSVALLTVYDMCKAMDKSMVISNIRLLAKSGGKSGDYIREAPQS